MHIYILPQCSTTAASVLNSAGMDAQFERSCCAISRGILSDPSSKQIIRYDLSTEEIVRTKARTNDCSDFVVVGDWVYSVSEDESSRMHLLMSNLLTGEEYLRVLLVK